MLERRMTPKPRRRPRAPSGV